MDGMKTFKKELRIVFGILFESFFLGLGTSTIVHASSQNNGIGQIKDNNLVNRNLVYFLIGAIIILLILFTVLIVNVKRRTKAEKAAVLARQKLKESYKELEKAYQEVTETKNALYSRYEELKISKEKIRKIAYTDYLTELPNRLAFTEMLDSVMLTLRNDEKIALIDIDLDNFKNINDTLGHSFGDELLIDVAHRLNGVLEEDDYLARIGGDEFVVLTQNIQDITSYEDKIKKIQKAFTYPFVLSTKEFFVTVSMGITFAPKDGKTTQTLVKNMDSAMYVAKENGKNDYCYFDDSINARMMKKIEMQSELRKAIENNEFVVYYQPQMDLETNRVVGFEALARWNHPQRGLIMPLEFIPLAEENGLIVGIGKKILIEACKQLKIWEDEGFRDITIAVNLSARQFKDSDFLSMVYEVIEETKVNPKKLEFEITETIALDDVDYTVATIHKLKELGITFSLDDFGTGYSSLNYLKQLPVNNLKIDKSFLNTVLVNKSDQKIVSTMIDLARVLNIDVIAEGVEIREQEEFLKDVNCNKAQGYFYSKPLPKEEAGEILRRNL